MYCHDDLRGGNDLSEKGWNPLGTKTIFGLNFATVTFISGMLSLYVRVREVGYMLECRFNDKCVWCCCCRLKQRCSYSDLGAARSAHIGVCCRSVSLRSLLLPATSGAAHRLKTIYKTETSDALFNSLTLKLICSLRRKGSFRVWLGLGWSGSVREAGNFWKSDIDICAFWCA